MDEPAYRIPDQAIDIEASVAAMARQYAEGCVKTMEDLSRYRALIEKYRPNVTLELGTYNGNSAAWFARETDAPVITVDVNPVVAYRDDPPPWDDLSIVQLVGSSIDFDIVQRAHQLIAGSFDRPLVICDSWHSSPHVLAEMEAYHNLVPLWGYMVVEDGIIRWCPSELQVYGGSGPLDAIEEFERRHTNWSSDKDLEFMFDTTQHPDGWLVRRA